MKAYLYSHHSDIDAILNELDQAVALALEDNIVEVPYHHIRGRYLIKKAQTLYKDAPSVAIDLLESAFSDYQMIIDAAESGQKVHPYQLSLAYMWSGRTLQLLSTLGVETVQSFERFEQAKGLMKGLPNIYPSHHAFSKLQQEAVIPYSWSRAKEDGILMGTIE